MYIVLLGAYVNKNTQIKKYGLQKDAFQFKSIDIPDTNDRQSITNFIVRCYIYNKNS